MGNPSKWLMAILCVMAFGIGATGTAVSADDEGGGGIDRHGMVNDMPLPTDAAALENGKERFGARCSYCHTPLGRGGSSGVCLACQKYKHDSKSSGMYGIIAGGIPGTKMGSFASSLSQEEMVNIIAYIRTLQERKIQDDLKAAKE
ncbi:MAG: c-type cytochrome [Betaproteobacteria bacterium]